MKKSSLSLLMGCFFVLSTSAQNTSGVYLNVQDYLTGKLYCLHLSKKGPAASDDKLLEKKHLVLTNDGTQLDVNLKDVYAIRCSDGRIIRQYCDGRYTLLDPGGAILLYMVRVYPAAKGNVMRTYYYFSKAAGSDIEALTLDNVKKAYSGNRKFNAALETAFRSDSELAAFDKSENCYKLDRLYAANN
jgi:hypothetical protein